MRRSALTFPSTLFIRLYASARWSRAGSPRAGAWTHWARPTRGSDPRLSDPRLHRKTGQLRPQLIINGHIFDLPVLRYRAMVNRVPRSVCKYGSALSPVHG